MLKQNLTKFCRQASPNTIELPPRENYRIILKMSMTESGFHLVDAMHLVASG